jgi:hypothetical protein
MIPTQKEAVSFDWQSRRDNGLRAPALGLARPDGTITGLSSQGTDYGGKQIELLGEIVPRLHRIGVIANAGVPARSAKCAHLRPPPRRGVRGLKFRSPHA